MTARHAILPAGCIAALLGGCAGLNVPSSGPRPHPQQLPQRSKLEQAQATHEYPGRAPREATAATPGPGPVQAARRFALRYINWNATDVTEQLRTLAADSVGQARSAMALAAAQTAGDYELRRGGIANHGTVEALAPLPRHRDQYVVVTRERTTATNTTAYDGLAPAWHVTLATVAELAPGRWVVSRWQPES